MVIDVDGQMWAQGGISSSVLSVFFTDNCYKLLKSLHLIGWEQICQWKTLTKRLMKCPPGLQLHHAFFLEKSMSGPFKGHLSLSQERICGVTANSSSHTPLVHRTILPFFKCKSQFFKEGITTVSFSPMACFFLNETTMPPWNAKWSPALLHILR